MRGFTNDHLSKKKKRVAPETLIKVKIKQKKKRNWWHRLQQCPPFGSDRRRGRGAKRTTSIKVADSREIVRRRKTTALRVREEGRSAGEESTRRERWTGKRIGKTKS
jgi:hypothetical protein